jgi:iron complex transport system substrate-binding protein
LYAIGAGAQVLAVDDLSDYPPPATEKMQGLSALEPNIETISGLEPDLVITDGTNAALLEQLESLGIAHWEGPAATSFDDVYEQIEQLEAVTGRPAEAASVVKRIQVEIDVVKASLPELDEPLSYYHELDDRYHSVTSDTFVGAVYGEFGLVNIADGSGTDSTHPQLNAEHIIDQDPDLIFLACTTSCGYTAADVSDRPGWSDLTAVRTGGVMALDEDIASRWGPRVVDYLHTVGEAVDAVAASTLDG